MAAAVPIGAQRRQQGGIAGRSHVIPPIAACGAPSSKWLRKLAEGVVSKMPVHNTVLCHVALTCTSHATCTNSICQMYPIRIEYISLKGMSASIIPVELPPWLTQFNWEEMERHVLSEMRYFPQHYNIRLVFISYDPVAKQRTHMATVLPALNVYDKRSVTFTITWRTI
jgi:hypothetical protein